MTDSYRITDHPARDTDPGAGTTARGRMDTLLWVLLGLAVVANVTASSIGQPLLGIPAGVAVLGLGIALVMRRRGRGV